MGAGGKTYSLPPEEGVRPDVRHLWDRAGLASGHAWAPCDVCGREALQPRAGGRRCFLTPGCVGTHRVPAGRPTPLQSVRAGVIGVDEIRRNPPRLSRTLRRLLDGA